MRARDLARTARSQPRLPSAAKPPAAPPVRPATILVWRATPEADSSSIPPPRNRDPNQVKERRVIPDASIAPILRREEVTPFHQAERHQEEHRERKGERQCLERAPPVELVEAAQVRDKANDEKDKWRDWNQRDGNLHRCG